MKTTDIIAADVIAEDLLEKAWKEDAPPKCEMLVNEQPCPDNAAWKMVKTGCTCKPDYRLCCAERCKTAFSYMMAVGSMACNTCGKLTHYFRWVPL